MTVGDSQPLDVALIWFDGTSTVGTAATLRWTGGGEVHLLGADGSPLAGSPFPLAALQLTPPLGRTQRRIAFGGPGRGETDDLDRLAALERRLGRGGAARWLQRVEGAWPLVVLLTLALVASALAFGRWGIPALARAAAMALPDEAAANVGHGALDVLDRVWLEPTALPEARRAELRRQFAALAEARGSPPMHLAFRRGVGPNAFALPDGTVLLTDELVALAVDDEEITAVLAHEIGHVVHRHALRLVLERASVGLLVGLVLGDLSDLGTLGAGAPSAVIQGMHSREHETEADDDAFDTLQQLGISPARFAAILQRLEQQARPDGGGETPGFFDSHPATAARVARFLAAASEATPTSDSGNEPAPGGR